MFLEPFLLVGLIEFLGNPIFQLATLLPGLVSHNMLLT